jgi:hypothetical protein
MTEPVCHWLTQMISSEYALRNAILKKKFNAVPSHQGRNTPPLAEAVRPNSR